MVPLFSAPELSGANPLKDAHAALDTAVLTAYGFSAKKDLLARLLSLNQQAPRKLKGRTRHASGRAQALSRREETRDGGLYSSHKLK